MKPIKIAVLSCNHGHARGYYGLKTHPKFDLRAVSVAPGYRGRTFLERLDGIDIYDDDRTMLDAHPEIEAVVMASANHLHFEQFRLCLERGLHILSMKVPTLDLAEYDEILRLRAAAGTVCAVELEMRFSPEVRRLATLVQSGKIGRLQAFTAANTSHNPVWWLPWHGSPAESYGRRVPLTGRDNRCRGGAMTDHPHIFDMLRVVTGEDVEEVYAETAPNMRSLEVEDFVFVTGRLRSGAVFSLDPSYSRTENPADIIGAGWEQYPKRVEVNMSAFGDKGYVIGDVYGNWIHHTGKPNHNYTSVRVGDRRGAGWHIGENFYSAVREGKPPAMSLEDHRRTIEIVDAAYTSLSTGYPVRL